MGNAKADRGEAHDARPLRGKLLISSEAVPAGENAKHRIDYVNGRHYAGMEDNDLRGLLDGTFLFGWNQPTQAWVRAGRMDWLHQYGEYELFRFIQRWEGIDAPDGCSVDDAAITMWTGPRPPRRGVSLVVYALTGDFEPGRGGVDGDNTSPPETGDVWWNDRAFDETPWGLPGASFASDRADADTGPMPLAMAQVPAAGGAVTLRSPELARYADRTLRAGEPLRFLFKLLDHQEDTRGTIAHFWSGNEGDSRSPGRKPRLSLWWEPPRSFGTVAVPVFLEPGRSVEVYHVPGSTEPTLVSFQSEGPGDGPVIEARSGEDTEWREIQGILPPSPDATRIRVHACAEVVAYGGPFEATLTDTWVQSAPPEEQHVVCTFHTPGGREIACRAEYAGSSTWAISFEPREVGCWSYRWNHTFAEPAYESRTHGFHVVLRSMEDAARALAGFEDKLTSAGSRERKRKAELKEELSRLVRAVMAILDPETFAGPEGRALRERIRSIRGLFGDAVPDPIPLEPAKQKPWEMGTGVEPRGRD